MQHPRTQSVFSLCSLPSPLTSFLQAGYEPEHRKKENQDAYIVWAGVEHSPMFGVCDGHGAQGNHVSNYLTKEFCTHLDAAGLDKSVEDVSFR
jgi:serine/threonine protein phosphatase PrpC